MNRITTIEHSSHNGNQPVENNGVQKNVTVPLEDITVFTGKENSELKNITPLTEEEARKMADKIEKNLKLVGRKLEESGFLITEMEKRGGWDAIGYKNYAQWANEKLGYEKTYAYTYSIAAKVEIRLRSSGDEKLLKFAEEAPVAHKAALSAAPEGKEKEAIELAEELAEAEGKTVSTNHFKRASEALQPKGIEEEKYEILIDQKIKYSKWRKVRNNSNKETLEAALKYWEELPVEEGDADKIATRIEELKGRLEKIGARKRGKKSGSDSPKMGEQEIKEEMPALALVMTSEYLKALPDDESRAKALICAVEGDERKHLDAIAQQFPLNQREDAISHIEEALNSLYTEYLEQLENKQGGEQESVGESSLPSIPSQGSTEPDSSTDEAAGTWATGTQTHTPAGELADNALSPETEAPDQAESIETDATISQVEPAALDPEAETSSNTSSAELQTTVDALFESSSESPGVKADFGNLEIEDDTATQLLPSADNKGEVQIPETIFDCKTLEEAQAYLSAVNVSQVWEETRELYEDWERLSEKVGEVGNQLEEKTVEVKELESKLEEKVLELKQKEQSVRQLRSIVTSLEEQLAEYKKADEETKELGEEQAEKQ
jgi:hypothetical protein